MDVLNNVLGGLGDQRIVRVPEQSPKREGYYLWPWFLRLENMIQVQGFSRALTPVFLTSSPKLPCIVILNIYVTYPQKDCKPVECRLCFTYVFEIMACCPLCPAYSGP